MSQDLGIDAVPPVAHQRLARDLQQGAFEGGLGHGGHDLSPAPRRDASGRPPRAAPAWLIRGGAAGGGATGGGQAADRRRVVVAA